jgi:hypothetical protein
LSPGCKGDDEEEEEEEEEETTTAPDTDDDDDTIEPIKTTFEPEYFGVFGVFAIDEATGDAVGSEGFDPYTGAPMHFPVQVTLLLTDTNGLYGAVTPYNQCMINISHEGPLSRSTWSDEMGLWTGFQLPDDAEITHDCNNLEGAAWAGVDLNTEIGKWSWGLGVEEIDEELAAQAEYGVGAQTWAELEPAMIGGGYYWNGLSIAYPGDFPDDYMDVGFAVANEINESFEWQLDMTGYPILLDGEDIPLDPTGYYPGVAPAAYEIYSFLYLDATTLLSPAPS